MSTKHPTPHRAPTHAAPKPLVHDIVEERTEAHATPDLDVEKTPEPAIIVDTPAPKPAIDLPAKREMPVPVAAPVVARPSWQDFRAAAELGAFVDARLLVGPFPRLIAGLVLYEDTRRFSLASVAEAGESHLRALSTDSEIEARIVFAEPG